MKPKSHVKRSSKPDFWQRSKENIDEDFKDWIYNQYLSQNTLSVYCDASINSQNAMAVGLCYVINGSVIKKYQLINDKRECAQPLFAELKAITVALSKFNRHAPYHFQEINIYTDIKNINDTLQNNVRFKNSCLKKAQHELIQIHNQTINQHNNLSINIVALLRDQKRHNPFLKAAHNAAKELISLNKK